MKWYKNDLKGVRRNREKTISVFYHLYSLETMMMMVTGGRRGWVGQVI